VLLLSVLLLCAALSFHRLAILGVTDQYILQRVDPIQYTQWRLELENHVAQHNVEEEPEDNIVGAVCVLRAGACSRQCAEVELWLYDEI